MASNSTNPVSSVYLTNSLVTFSEIWGTIAWIFIAVYVMIHTFVSWYAWRVLSKDDFRIGWYWPFVGFLLSLLTGTVTGCVFGMYYMVIMIEFFLRRLTVTNFVLVGQFLF